MKMLCTTFVVCQYQSFVYVLVNVKCVADSNIQTDSHPLFYIYMVEKVVELVLANIFSVVNDHGRW